MKEIKKIDIESSLDDVHSGYSGVTIVIVNITSNSLWVFYTIIMAFLVLVALWKIRTTRRWIKKIWQELCRYTRTPTWFERHISGPVSEFWNIRILRRPERTSISLRLQHAQSVFVHLFSAMISSTIWTNVRHFALDFATWIRTKATALYTQIFDQAPEERQNDEDFLCRICASGRAIKFVLLPCIHALCEPCKEALGEHGFGLCPFCNGHIQQFRRLHN